MSRTAVTWFTSGPRECSLSQRQIQEISSKFESLQGKLPREFARQLHGLAVLNRWKATEFRQFLLYTGPVALCGVLSENFYNHFVPLTVALSILFDSDDNTRNAYTTHAEELLRYCYKTSTKLYSPIVPSYNMYCLTHLAEDDRNLEPL